MYGPLAAQIVHATRKIQRDIIDAATDIDSVYIEALDYIHLVDEAKGVVEMGVSDDRDDHPILATVISIIDHVASFDGDVTDLCISAITKHFTASILEAEEVAMARANGDVDRKLPAFGRKMTRKAARLIKSPTQAA